MTATYTVFVDESGDEGFKFGNGTSEWFVLSAVIVRRARELELVALTNGIKTRLNKLPLKKPLHFRRLKHEQKVLFADQISTAALRTVSILIHKPSLRSPETFQQRYRLYFYAVRLLCERVSWFCRDRMTPDEQGDGSTEIIFSNRSGMSYAEMRAYLSLLKTQSQTPKNDIRIEWSVIRPDQIRAFSPGKRAGLQVADAVASGLFSAVELGHYGFAEDRYAQLLKRNVYRHQGSYFGYGLKFWPKETRELLATEKHLSWVDTG